MQSYLLLSHCIKGWKSLVLAVAGELITYRSEIAPAKRRGGLVVMNHIGMVTGLSAAFW
jgi:hypothetical protein